MDRISPFVTILHHPDKLVLQIRSTGAYQSINWFRNGQMLLGATGPLPDTFVHFGDIYVVDDTTVDDLGVYEVYLTGKSSLQRTSNVTYFVAVEQGKQLYQHSEQSMVLMCVLFS